MEMVMVEESYQEQNESSFQMNQLSWKLELRFPSCAYAEAAMNTIEVDPPFQDTKNKKTSIKRNMSLAKSDSLNEGAAILVITFTSNEEEVNSLRTCVTSFIGNMTMVCQTMKELGN